MTLVVVALLAALSSVVLIKGHRPTVVGVAPVETTVSRTMPPDSTPAIPETIPGAPAARPTPPPTIIPKRSRPAQEPDTSRARYPKEWDVSIAAGSRLDSLRRSLDAQFALLPPKDLEDRSPLPIWFRVYLRKQNPDLPTQGLYQYPRAARTLLRWMVSHPDSVRS